MRVPHRFLAAIVYSFLLIVSGPGETRAEAVENVVRAEETATLQEKIGQMILVGFLGNTVDRAGFKQVRAQMESGEIGGVLYLGRNLKNRQSVRRMNAELKEAAQTHLPPLIAIDQEGGKVQRLKRHHGFPHTPAAKRMARRADPSEAAKTYGALASALADWGFTLNLGPVVDVDVNPRNPIIGRLGRSYSSDPDRVADYGAAFVSAHRHHGVLTALKHFPGHGSSRRDSHKGAVDVSATWSSDELEPFRQLIDDANVDLIMTAHVINRLIESVHEDVPMSLSETALVEVLRNDLGFDGVVISDDIQMDAIRWNFSLEEAVIRAVQAQTDILLFANDKRPDPRIPEKVAKILLEAAENDPLLVRKIDAAYGRILTLKDRLRESHDSRTSVSRMPDSRLSAIAPGEHLCLLSPDQ
ncbi:MAG: hypothetical protein NXI02_19880 [Rhodobacteraceae bacterium]|nr:hypothetical protein [Paracoccaceae bacterium]